MSGISTFHPLPLRARASQILTLLVATCLTVLAVSAGAAARTGQPTATISSATLRSAITARTADKRALLHNSSRLSTCLRTDFGHCAGQRIAVAHSRTRLAAAERYVLSLSARIARLRHASKHTYGGSGTSGGGSTGGGTSQSGTSGSGTTGTGTTGSGTTGTGTTGSGTTGSGTSTSGSGTSGSTGTSGTSGTTSTGLGGQTEPTGSSGPFEMGVVAGSALSYELPFIHTLGAHTARMEFEIATPTSQMDSVVEAYARADVRPLLLASFYGTLPTAAQAQSLGAWAAQFGPGGSFWKGKNLPASSAVTSIEFGNETSYAYQFTNDSASAYASRAQTYALRFKEAQAAIHAANPKVGLLAQGDPGNAPGSSWMENMFKAVPNLGQLVGGWTVHPYGPNWQTIMDKVVSSAQAAGAPSSIPLDVTEWGLSTDDGRCLEENYGFNACMTYQEAATTLESNLSAMRARYGNRLAAFYLFQAHDQDATGTTTEREGYFGALQSDEAPKGAYTTAVESLLSANP
jgi:hypothetical protein